jgi:SAM-dependent methyltransferase
MSQRAKYGVDGFPYLVGLLGGGTILAVGGVTLTRLARDRVGRAAGGSLSVLGVAALVPGLLGLRYVLVGKRRHRDRMLDLLTWTGDETVLDVGTGAGLLAIGAAKRVPLGHVVACDIWSAKDLSGNTIGRTRRNAELEGVAGRIDIRTEDARQLSLEDASVDVVLSALCLHNIAGPGDREAAVNEVWRVLRPGGRAVISDLSDIDDYARWLTTAGCTNLQISKAPATFPPQRVIVATK